MQIMPKPSLTERIADPLSNDFAGTISYLRSQGRPFSVEVTLTPEAAAHRDEIVKRLQNYGSISRNFDWAPFFLVNVTAETAFALERDYWNDNFPELQHIEVNTDCVSLHAGNKYRADSWSWRI